MTTMSEDGTADVPTNDVDVTVTIDDDRTVIDVTGERDVAFVVRSDGGEHIYLPPAEYDEPTRRPSEESPYRETSGRPDTPYRAASDSYQSAGGREQTPYDGVPDPEPTGLESTSTGVRIVHPEPIFDLRLLR
jgi:hypothetical protein